MWHKHIDSLVFLAIWSSNPLSTISFDFILIEENAFVYINHMSLLFKSLKQNSEILTVSKILLMGFTYFKNLLFIEGTRHILQIVFSKDDSNAISHSICSYYDVLSSNGEICVSSSRTWVNLYNCLDQ